MEVPDPKLRPTISVDEAAELLGIHRQSAHRAVRSGEIPSIRIGARVIRVPTAPLLRILGHLPEGIDQ